MKRILFISGICLTILFFSFYLAGRIICVNGIKEHINIAKKYYPGKAEDALIAYLADTTNSPQKRSDVAIWTLGQIRSKKALPVLYELYKNDPQGTTCKGRHNKVLCQYEIYKAIISIEHGWLGAKELLPNCTQISNKEKNDAKIIYTNCSKIAGLWLDELDKNGYSYLANLKLSDLLKKEISEDAVKSFALNNERVFGKVKERKFIAAHLWLNNKLLTYFPNYDKALLKRIGKEEARDGFYKINPRYMGLQKSEDMFKSFPEGNYVILMYQSVPTNKQAAQEMIILWKDIINTWQVVSYKIADDI